MDDDELIERIASGQAGRADRAGQACGDGADLALRELFTRHAP